MSGTTAVDAVLALFELLAPEERGEALRRLTEAYQRHTAGDESDTERMLRSLRRVAEVAGRIPPTSTEYKDLAPRLIAAGEDVEPFTRVYRHFGSWPRATEALDLAQTTTPLRIEARFRSRQLGQVSRYTETTLGETLARCVDYYNGEIPLVTEFEWWRQRELELARARGEHLHLPSQGPYRRRWGTWEAALLHLGYATGQLADRFEQRRYKRPIDPHPFVPDDAVIAGLSGEVPAKLPLKHKQVAALRDAYRSLPRRSRYVLTHRLGLDVPVRSLRETAEPLGLHLGRVWQLEREALAALVQACAADGAGPLDENLSDGVEEVLRVLARVPRG